MSRGDNSILASHKSISLLHSVWKSKKKSHSTLRAKRATFRIWVDKSSLKMPKVVNFSELWKPEACGQTELTVEWLHFRRESSKSLFCRLKAIAGVQNGVDGNLIKTEKPFICPSDGHFGDPNDCTKFYKCAHGTPVIEYCPATLFWNQGETPSFSNSNSKHFTSMQ